MPYSHIYEAFLVSMGSIEFRKPEGFDSLNPQHNVRVDLPAPTTYEKAHTMSNRHDLPTLLHPSLDLSENTAVQEY